MNMEAITVFVPKYETQASLPCRNSLFPVNILSRFPLMSFSFKPVKNVGLSKTTIRACGDRESLRTFKKLPPSEWGHHFLSVPIDSLEMNEIGREIEELKPKIKGMLMPSQGVEETKKRMILVYLLVSLGIAYHFVDEINEILKQGFKAREDIMAGEEDLYTVSIIFWVFRTYGYNMSSDVFKRFKREDGMFKECLVGDAKGMLSLYEAAQLETRTDKILDEALSFTSGRLELLAEGGTIPPHISTLIKNSLYISQHHNNEMIFAKGYISFYEHEEDHDKMLLRFSKLNFRFLQLHWIQELKTLTKWWKEQDLASKLPPYFRDRMVECYSFAFGIQPQYSRERIIATKFFMLFTLVDDTCDRYALYPEIKILVECMERLLPDWVDSLPDYMKPIFKLTLNIFEESKSMGRYEEEESYIVQGALEEDDMSRGDEVNVINYYMKQHRVSKEETFKELQKMLRDTNKLLNEEFLKMAKRMPIDILQRAINCGNMTSVTYADGEGLTNPIGRFKDHLTSLFVDLMPL